MVDFGAARQGCMGEECQNFGAGRVAEVVLHHILL